MFQSSHHKRSHQQGNAEPPSARKLRRTCNKELYRTAKRLRQWIPPDKLEQANRLYYKKVVHHVTWITENRSHRKKLADWWEEAIAPDIAELWDIEVQRLVRAFRDAFGG